MFKQTKVIVAAFLVAISTIGLFADQKVEAKEKEDKKVLDYETQLKHFNEQKKVFIESSHEERMTLIDAMILHNYDANIIRDCLVNTKDPELKKAMKTLLINKIRWVPLRLGTRHYQPHGITEKGLQLHLAKAEINGDVVFGTASNGAEAHFPHGDKVVTLKEFRVHSAFFDWRTWNKDLKDVKFLGKNKQGKQIFAARAWVNNSIHMGMFVEGSEKAMIPVDGKVHKVKEFEVLVNHNPQGKSKLQPTLIIMRRQFGHLGPLEVKDKPIKIRCKDLVIERQ